jgi:hypothetical protein
MVKILEQSDEPIIEKNKSWQASENNRYGQCQGYRINEKYNTQKLKNVRISKRLSDKIIKNSKSDIAKSYQFLTDEFKINKITIESKVYDFIKNYYYLLKSHVKNNKYQNIMLDNQIGKMIDYVQKINNKDIWCKVSKENHRLNSTFTSIPKELRQFILINGEKMEMLDLKTSQPYILSTIIKTRFFFETKEGYNLKTICPIEYDKIIKSIDDSIKIYSNNPMVCNESPYKQSLTRTCLFMWCEFLSQKEAENLAEYGLQSFENDFYMDMAEMFILENDQEIKIDRHELREKIKGVMMLILFDDNIKNRNNNEIIQIFKKVYPGVNTWIEMMHRMLDKKGFAYLLQRSESFLMLNNVCRVFKNQFKSAPIFTVHDALFTTKDYMTNLVKITEETLFQLTGKKPGLKHCVEPISVIPCEKTIETRWKKIKPVKTKKRFEKIQHTILEQNLYLAEEFKKTILID